MKPALVKIDVAVMVTGKPVSALFDMADGAALVDGSLSWVFDLANGDKDERRDLRFWLPELEALGETDMSGLKLDQVVGKILPSNRTNFHAGEVDLLFQVRHNTRRELLDSAGMNAGRNFYSRGTLVEFLKARWIGAGQRSEVRGQRAEGGGQRAEVRGQRAEAGCQKQSSSRTAAMARAPHAEAAVSNTPRRGRTAAPVLS